VDDRTQVSAAVDMYVPSVNGTTGTFLAVHVGPGGCRVSKYYGIFFTIFPANSSFVVSSDISKFAFGFMCWMLSCNIKHQII